MGNVLLSFRVANFRSIRDMQELHFTKSTRSANRDFEHPDVVPVAAIFGPNASGKSNVLRAVRTMHTIIQQSATTVDRPLPFDPFVLTERPAVSTLFGLSLRIDGVRFDYEFEFNADEITRERLLSWPKGRQRVLFERDVQRDDVYYFGDSLSGSNQSVSRATRASALLLSTAQLVKHEQLAPIHEQIVSLIRVVRTDDSRKLLAETLEAVQRETPLLNRVAGLLKRADLGITSLVIEEDEEAQRANESLQRILETLDDSDVKFVFDGGGRALVPRLVHAGTASGVSLPFASESLGTQSFFALLGPILQRLRDGGVLVVDEIDTSLHPRLVNELVQLFQNVATNPKQAQLLLTTHDVTVMMNTGDYDVLDREQVWFTDKNSEGETELYALTDFSVRANEVFSRGYLMDRYGAVPQIDRDAILEFLRSDEPGGERHGEPAKT